MAGKIVRGHLIPEANMVREIAKQIQDEAHKDPKVMKALKANPRAFLGDRGLPVDAQRELLRNAGLTGGFANDCTVTCITTECCFTCWFTDFGLAHIPSGSHLAE